MGLGTGADISSARRWISLAVSGCYSAFVWLLQCFFLFFLQCFVWCFQCCSPCYSVFLVFTVFFFWWLQCFFLSVTVMRRSARVLIFLVLVVGSFLLFLVVTVFCLVVTVFFVCYSDVGLGTGADISSARRWISFAASGWYSVLSGCYRVLLSVTVTRRSAREMTFLVLIVGSLLLFLVFTVFFWLLQCFFLSVTVMRGSARELIFLVLVVGSLSVLLTYHLTWRLPQRDHGTLRIRFDGRLEIFRSVVVPASPYGEDKREGIQAPPYGEDNRHGLQAPPFGEDTHQGLEVTDLETPGGGRHKQRQTRQREPPAELLRKVRQVSDNLYRLSRNTWGRVHQLT